MSKQSRDRVNIKDACANSHYLISIAKLSVQCSNTRRAAFFLILVSSAATSDELEAEAEGVCCSALEVLALAFFTLES